MLWNPNGRLGRRRRPRARIRKDGSWSKPPARRSSSASTSRRTASTCISARRARRSPFRATPPASTGWPPSCGLGARPRGARGHRRLRGHRRRRARRRRPAAGRRQPAPDPRLRPRHGRLAKTDRLDAEAIALFAERIRPEPRPVPDADAQALGGTRRPPPPDRRDDRHGGNRRRQARAPGGRTIAATLKVLRGATRRASTATSTTPSAAPPLGAPPRTCSACRASAPSPRPHPDRRDARTRPPRPARGRRPGRRRPGQPRLRRHRADTGPSPAAGPPSATSSSWPPSQPSAGTRPCKAHYRQLTARGRPKRSPSSPACAASSPSSTPSSGPKRHGAPLDPQHGRSWSGCDRHHPDQRDRQGDHEIAQDVAAGSSARRTCACLI